MNAPTFGQYLRAARLMFHWDTKLGCFVRVRAFPVPDGLLHPGPLYHVEMCSPGSLPKSASKHEYWLWWENRESLLDAGLQCGGLSDGVVHRELVVDDDGRPLIPRKAVA